MTFYDISYILLINLFSDDTERFCPTKERSGYLISGVGVKKEDVNEHPLFILVFQFKPKCCLLLLRNSFKPLHHAEHDCH